MSGRGDDGTSVPLPRDAPDHLADFVAGRSAMVRLDTADIGWMGSRPTASPLLAIRPGATASTVTLSVGWGLAAVPSPEVSLAIVNGHLSIDARQLPSGLRSDLESWVQAFNRQLRANNRELASFGVDGTVLEVSARAPQAGTFAPLASAGVLGLAAAAAALWPRPAPGTPPANLPLPIVTPPPAVGSPPVAAPTPIVAPPGKPLVVLVPLVFLLIVGGFAIAWWNVVGDDSGGSESSTDPTVVDPAPSDPTAPSTSENVMTGGPTSAPFSSVAPSTAAPSTDPPTSEPPDTAGGDCEPYPPTTCTTTPLSPTATTDANGNVLNPPSGQGPTDGSDVNSPGQPPGQGPSVGDGSDGPGSATDSGEPDAADAIPATGSDTGTTLRIAAFALAVGLLALYATRRRKPEGA